MLLSQTRWLTVINRLEFLTTTKVPSGIEFIIKNLAFQRVRDDTTYHYEVSGNYDSILDALKYIIENRSSEILEEVGLTGELDKSHLVTQVLNPMINILGANDIEQSLRLINRILILYGEN